ncbi:MAG: hypothetical protein WDO19_09990 [Bacteroidota bacterium]
MSKPFMFEETKISDYHLPEEVQAALQTIENKIDAEIKAKQNTIERQEGEIRRLHSIENEKAGIISQLNEKIAECSRNSEGSRQLINKLLGDIERLHQDIDWYKRTYEKRSLLGTIKEKLFGKKP